MPNFRKEVTVKTPRAYVRGGQARGGHSMLEKRYCVAGNESNGACMQPLRELRALLERLPPGKVPIDFEARVKELLAEVWSEFAGAEETKMEPHKVWRAENLQWDPPVLSFIVERHGGLVMGSTRAELQKWNVDFEKMQATYDPEGGYRQIFPRSPRWKAEPVAEEIAKLIQERREDPRLQWLKNGKVRILTSKIVPGGYKQTLQDRKKRFFKALDEKLSPFGWRRVRNIYEKTGM